MHRVSPTGLRPVVCHASDAGADHGQAADDEKAPARAPTFGAPEHPAADDDEGGAGQRVGRLGQPTRSQLFAVRFGHGHEDVEHRARR